MSASVHLASLSVKEYGEVGVRTDQLTTTYTAGLAIGQDINFADWHKRSPLLGGDAAITHYDEAFPPWPQVSNQSALVI